MEDETHDKVSASRSNCLGCTSAAATSWCAVQAAAYYQWLVALSEGSLRVFELATPSEGFGDREKAFKRLEVL